MMSRNIVLKQKAYRAESVVCIYSGGMDSYTLAGFAHENGWLHSCLSFDYGQRHKKELEYARAVTEDWGTPHEFVSLRNLKPHLLGSSLTEDDIAVPEGHYADDNMKLTVVPNRNMIMLSIAIAHAVSHACDTVWFGAHAGDHTIYPDCRPDFTRAMDHAAQIANWRPIRIEAPFQYLTKADILRIGHGIDLYYGNAWTCYKGGQLACGVCGSCQERLEAFEEIKQPDPLEYAPH
jgi:7-cyano-7-deazaguanine synthase